MRNLDVVVVGGGAHGSAAAWWLAKRGREVVLLERFEPGHVRGSSHGGSRIFRFAYPDVEYVRLAQAALPLWRELEDETGTTVLEQTGGIDHGHGVTAIQAALAALGVRHDMLPAAAAAERFSGMRFETDVLFQPDAGRTHAGEAVSALQRAASARGADVRFDEGALRIEAAGERALVVTANETYAAPVAVVACGAWTTSLLDGVVQLPPLRITREQPAFFAAREGSAEWPSFIHRNGGDEPAYGVDSPGEGMKVGLHRTGAHVDPDARTFEPDPSMTRDVERYASKWLPGLDPSSIGTTTCLYTSTPNEDFVLDRRGPIVVSSACSGHGFKFTPVIGRVLADLCEGANAPERFRLGAGSRP